MSNKEAGSAASVSDTQPALSVGEAAAAQLECGLPASQLMLTYVCSAALSLLNKQ